ncbi:MAG: ribonuclease Z [Candidatus Bathyarchaeota archaeon]|nr:MAG: ribonuclease Z [Candidatus Bathyarchaeota archaeon]
MELIFLGTGASIPTENRNSASIVLTLEGEMLVFDCGEGTQRQMVRAHVGFRRKMDIFVTHIHGDHTLGLLGLLQTMSLLGRDNELQVFGPSGLDLFLSSALSSLRVKTGFPVKVIEVGPGIILERNSYLIEAVRADHNVESLSFGLLEKKRPGKFDAQKAEEIGIPEGPARSLLQRGRTVTLKDGTSVKPSEILGPSRPGRKVVYSGDTRPSTEITRLAQGADLLIHEATYDDSLAEKAAETGHSTPSQAAEIAREAKVRRLILTHISSRYPDPQLLLSQARARFQSVEVAQDLQRIKIPKRESS